MNVSVVTCVNALQLRRIEEVMVKEGEVFLSFEELQMREKGKAERNAHIN